MATMLDVAKKANVALSTVSYALNGTRPISEETQQRIFAAMKELSYRPHALARGLASKKSRILALLFSAPERGLGITELEFVTSAADAARENGYHLVLWPSEMNDPSALQELTRQGLVDGVVAMEVHLNDKRIHLLQQLHFPFSMIGRCDDAAGIGYADIDFDGTTREAVHYLAGLGHRHIAFVNHSQFEFDSGYGPAVRAASGFEKAMREGGLYGVTRLCAATPTAGYEAFHHVLSLDPALTALIVMNDRAAPGILRAVQAHGWEIPRDFSIVSMVSSAHVAEMMNPPLTTMAPPTAELGRLGVELLIQQLEEGDQDLPQVLLPCQLVVRGSSGAAPMRS